MPIATSDVDIRLSGGAGNSNVNASIGGVMSSTLLVDNVLNNLFEDVPGSESLPGEEKYRLVYIQNDHGSLTMKNVRVFVSSNSTSTTEEMDIALAAAGLNATETAIADQFTAPGGGVTFTHPTTYATGLAPANIPAGQRYGVWVRETIDPSSTAKDNSTTIIKVDYDTNE
jgi:hypothetical protein